MDILDANAFLDNYKEKINWIGREIIFRIKNALFPIILEEDIEISSKTEQVLSLHVMNTDVDLTEDDFIGKIHLAFGCQTHVSKKYKHVMLTHWDWNKLSINVDIYSHVIVINFSM